MMATSTSFGYCRYNRDIVSAYALSRTAFGTESASRYSAAAAARNPCSRLVRVGSEDASAAALTPRAIAAGSLGPPANGLPQALSAIPQYAMEQVESAARTSPKARSHSSHQNEWSTAMACSKRF